MIELFKDANFWLALSNFAWPIALTIIALLFRKLLAQLLRREALTIKVAGMELSVQDVAEQTGKGMSDLQERVAILEQNFSNGGKANAKSFSSANTSVLWVDDYPSNNAFIIEKLENEGIRVRKELSTDAAIGALGNDEFQMIISDLGRVENGQDNPFAGLEFARALRASGHNAPLLIFAGQRGLENRDKLLTAGANQVTSSPIDVFKFVEQYAAVEPDGSIEISAK